MAIPRVQLADYGHGPRRRRDSPGKCIGLPGTATRERFSQVGQLLKEMRLLSCRPARATAVEWVAAEYDQSTYSSRPIHFTSRRLSCHRGSTVTLKCELECAYWVVT